VVGPTDDLLTRLRVACASVAERARHVRIVHEAVPDYARSLPEPPDAAGDPELAPDENRAAFWITLDAINFGSGWFPTLRKRPGQSGYFTIAAGLRERFQRIGPWSAEQLAAIGRRELAHTLDQDPDHELIGLFARSLNDLGRRLASEHGGSFTALVDSADGSAQRLVGHLAGWDCFGDTSAYEEIQVPFLKRAQITAADLHRGGGAAFNDLGRLTMFADNLVPDVLRLDGVLEFDADLTGRIEREELIEHGSPEEIEIRACAVRSVELMVSARPDLTATQIDEVLWNRGGEPRYKGRPRHRSRCTAY
jgi:hypothetical protein